MAAALQSYHDTRCFLQKIDDLEYKVLEDNKRALMDALKAYVYHSQEQSSKSVAAAEAAQEAARKACKAADLQYKAAQSGMRASGELRKITELISEAGPAAGVLILVHCDTACQQAVSALP